MHVCLLFWVYLTAACLTLIQSRSSFNHTYQHTCLCVCVCVCNRFYFRLFFWEYLTAGCLTLCCLTLFSSIQVALYVQQPAVGPATRHFCRAFIASVSVRVSCGWVLRYCVWVKVLIFYHYLTCIFLCFSCCLCVYVFVSRCAPTDKQTQFRD